MYKMIEKATILISQLFFMLIFILMFGQILTRYFFGISYAWNIELCRYSLVWVVFFGAAYVKQQDGHIRMDMLSNYIIKKYFKHKQVLYSIFQKLLSVALLVIIIIFGCKLAYNSRDFRSQAMQLSQFYLYISVPVGMTLYLITELQGLFNQVRTPHL